MWGDNATTRLRPEDVELLNQVAQQIAIAVENGLAYQEIADLKEKLSKEKLYLEEEIKTDYDFEDIIGSSAALKRVLKQVEIVAPTDSTVLILGETGTGKELLARAIHDRSSRRERTMVKLNCAAIPTGLLESELFGHERGAFTGAIAQKVGRFELADGGTLFLDEVGDIPLELQSKLLRVLQEQEFERLGGTRTIKVNIRSVGGHEPQPDADGRRKRISQRFVLSPQCVSVDDSRASRPPRRHSFVGSIFCPEVRPADEENDRFDLHGGDGGT